MFQKALVLNSTSMEGPDPRLEHLISKQLGFTYKLQDNVELAIESFIRALELESTPEIANEVGKLYLRLQDLTLALEYCSYAIEMSAEDVLRVEPEDLARYYSDRVKIYELL